MLFLGWQGIYTFLAVCAVVFVVILYFAKRLNREPMDTEATLIAH